MSKVSNAGMSCPSPMRVSAGRLRRFSGTTPTARASRPPSQMLWAIAVPIVKTHNAIVPGGGNNDEAAGLAGASAGVEV